jgi:FkbM family methyltransferase
MVSNQALTALLVMTTIVTAYFVLSSFWFPAKLAYIMATGGSHLCTWDDAIESHRREISRQEESRNRAKGARLVKSDGDLDLWETRDGPLWIPKANPYPKNGFRFVRWGKIEGMAEPPVREGDVVIDCGGHWGNSALAALSMGASLVITFEPDPTNVECVRRNLKTHIESGKAIVYDKGVWDQEDTLFFRHHGHSADGSIDTEHGIPVGVTTIDNVVSQLGLERVDFIKMDIEGAEQRALQGAQETLRRFKPRLAIGSYHLRDDHSEIPKLVQLARADYMMECSRCLPAHGMIMPNLYYFH